MRKNSISLFILYTCIYYVFIISLIYLMNSFFCKIIITEVFKTVLDFVIILFEFQFSRNCKNGYYSIYIYILFWNLRHQDLIRIFLTTGLHNSRQWTKTIFLLNYLVKIFSSIRDFWVNNWISNKPRDSRRVLNVTNFNKWCETKVQI